MPSHPVIFPVTTVSVSLPKAWQGLGVTSPVRIRDSEVQQVSMVSGKVPCRSISSLGSGAVWEIFLVSRSFGDGIIFPCLCGLAALGAGSMEDGGC